MTDWMDAATAARRLGVSRQTLYAYASRGLLHPQRAPDGRRSLYHPDEIALLAGRQARGRQPDAVAAETLDWGRPVLNSGITLIDHGQLYYRGVSAVTLAQHDSVESVAAWLWQCPQAEAFGPCPAAQADPLLANAVQALQDLPAGERLPVLFAIAARQDIGTAGWQHDRARLAAGCGHLLRLLAACLTGGPVSDAPLHVQCARAWHTDAAGADLIRRALILCADHELNASGFTARCVASTGASLAAAIAAGLAALSGPRHGGATARVEAIRDDLVHPEARQRLAARLQRGETLPGFGHPLYPQGDVRAAALLTHILPHHPDWQAGIGHAVDLTGHAPSVDCALVALVHHLGLPPGSAFGLFALGRAIGWIAHALEQRADGVLIRPRARYSGVMPAA